MAVADFAEYGTGEAPPLLRKAWRVKTWGDPYGGGWMNWPAGQVDKMTSVLNVYNAMTAYKNATGNYAEWANRNKPIMEIVTSIFRMRIDRDNGR